jgi:hypothetical protein
MVLEPKMRAASLMIAGRASAAVFSETLSAPARRTALMSATVRMPPLTVRGMWI